MIRQTVLPFKLERTNEALTAHGGLALLAEYTHALGLRALTERYLPRPGSNRGYAPAVFVEPVVLLLQAGGPWRTSGSSSGRTPSSRCPAAWARHTLATLRWKLVQVAGRIIRHAGQVVLRLVVEAETLALFCGIRRQCWALGGVT